MVVVKKEEVVKKNKSQNGCGLAVYLAAVAPMPPFDARNNRRFRGISRAR